MFHLISSQFLILHSHIVIWTLVIFLFSPGRLWWLYENQTSSQWEMFTVKGFMLAASPSHTRPHPLTRLEGHVHCHRLERRVSRWGLRAAPAVELGLCTLESLGGNKHTQTALGTGCSVLHSPSQHPKHPSTLCRVLFRLRWPDSPKGSLALCLGSPKWLHPEGGKVSSGCQTLHCRVARFGPQKHLVRKGQIHSLSSLSFQQEYKG